MKYRNLSLLVVLSISLFGLLQDVSAQSPQPSVNDKEVDVLQEIDKSEHSGSISHEEAAAFKDREAKISLKEQELRSKNDGKLIESDQKSLKGDLARLQNDVRRIKSIKADNTGKNVGDGSLDAATAQTQSLKKADVEISRQVREKLIGDKNLSQNAKNVKIITIDGAIILRGPVDSADESIQINAIAKAIAGDDHVANELQIVSRK